jgi:transcription elongation factor GreA
MREISSVAYSKLQGDLKLLDEQILESEKRLQEALGFGDLSENTEYDAEKSNLTQKQNLKMSIEQLLRTSKPKQGYSTNISSGTLITVKEISDNGDVIRDHGLLMFDEVGDKLFDGKINPDSNLGRAVEGTTGGVFTIQDLNGSPVKFEVTVESESRLDEFMSLYFMNKEERLKLMYASEEPHE